MNSSGISLKHIFGFATRKRFENEKSPKKLRFLSGLRTANGRFGSVCCAIMISEFRLAKQTFLFNTIPFIYTSVSRVDNRATEETSDGTEPVGAELQLLVESLVLLRAGQLRLADVEPPLLLLLLWTGNRQEHMSTKLNKVTSCHI